MVILEYTDDKWYRLEGDIPNYFNNVFSLVFANFNKVIEIDGNRGRYLKYNKVRDTDALNPRHWHDITPLIMKMFTSGKTFDDLPTFTALTGHHNSTNFSYDENGNLYEHDVPIWRIE